MSVFARYTLRSLTRSPARTLVTAIGIVLSMALFTAVITGGNSGWQYFIRREIAASGPWHGFCYDLTGEQKDRVLADEALADTAAWQEVGWTVLGGGGQSRGRYLCVTALGEGVEELVTFHLTDGRMPRDETEIILPNKMRSAELNDVDGRDYPLESQVTFELGRRTRDGQTLGEEGGYFIDPEEQVTDAVPRAYTVVGFYQPMKADVQGELYSAVQGFTGGGGTGRWRVFFTMKHPHSLFSWRDASGLPVCTHSLLMRFYGVLEAADRTASMFFGLVVLLVGLVALGSVALIYNAFSISVGERIWQYGLLRSVGATKKQLRSTVLWEALFLSAAGVPLGLAVGCFGMGITLRALSGHFAALDPESYGVRMELALSPLPLARAAAVCLATIVISALIPARRAVNLSPMEAIRRTADVRVHPNEVRTSPLVGKLFGFEGVMASKNFKRGRRRHSATVLSLALSVVLFISASSLCAYLTGSVDAYTRMGSAADLIYYDNGASGDDPDGTLALLAGAEGVREVMYWDNAYGCRLRVSADLLSPEVRDLVERETHTYLHPSLEDGFLDSSEGVVQNYGIVYVDDGAFRRLCAASGLNAEDYFDPDRPAALLYNRLNFRLSGRIFSGPFLEADRLPFTLYCDGVSPRPGYVLYDYDSAGEVYLYYPEGEWAALAGEDGGADPSLLDESLILKVPAAQAEAAFALNVTAAVDEAPFALEQGSAWLIYPYSMRGALFPEGAQTQRESVSLGGSSALRFGVLADDRGTAFQDICRRLDRAGLPADRLEEQTFADRYSLLASVAGVFAYGFILLISLVALANVFNTVSTNISLRRREFAVLESLGLSGRGLRRMLRYECAIYGLRALLLGLPAAVLVTLMAHRMVSGVIFVRFYIPWTSVAAAVGSVFAVVFASMAYAVGGLRRSGLAEALKSESF